MDYKLTFGIADVFFEGNLKSVVYFRNGTTEDLRDLDLKKIIERLEFEYGIESGNIVETLVQSETIVVTTK